MVLLTKDLKLYDTETFGMNSWGSNSQESIIKKRKNWYIHIWASENEWVEDYNEDIKLNIIKEFKNIEEVKKDIDDLQESLKDIEEREKILKEWNKTIDVTEDEEEVDVTEGENKLMATKEAFEIVEKDLKKLEYINSIKSLINKIWDNKIIYYMSLNNCIWERKIDSKYLEWNILYDCKSNAIIITYYDEIENKFKLDEYNKTWSLNREVLEKEE